MGKLTLALLGFLLTLVPAAAQDWPTKTVRMIVPFGPGSTPDMVARLIAASRFLPTGVKMTTLRANSSMFLAGKGCLGGNGPAG